LPVTLRQVTEPPENVCLAPNVALPVAFRPLVRFEHR
jgi:hypothetical protein